jgi:hypothetical protein
MRACRNLVSLNFITLRGASVIPISEFRSSATTLLLTIGN